MYTLRFSKTSLWNEPEQLPNEIGKIFDDTDDKACVSYISTRCSGNETAAILYFKSVCFGLLVFMYSY